MPPNRKIFFMSIIGFALIGFIFYEMNLSRLPWLIHVQSDVEVLAMLPQELVKNPDPVAFSQLALVKQCGNIEPFFKTFLEQALSSKSYTQSQALIAKAILTTANSQNIGIDDKMGCLKYFVATDRTNISEDGQLSKTLNAVSAELAKLPDMSTAENNFKDSSDLVDRAKEEVENIRANLKQVVNLHGVIAGQHDDHIYEFATVSGERGLLRTTATRFQSRGFFTIAAKKVEDVDVKLKEDYGGFDTKWPVYEEVENVGKMRENLKTAEGQLGKMKKNFAFYQETMRKVRESSSQAEEIVVRNISAIDVGDRDVAQVK